MKVLIVDDEEHVREGVELAIDWEAYGIRSILMAEDGVSAMELVRREDPDLIICDMSMPRMDGPRFLELLREEGWNAKVIVLSGYQEFRYARATLLASGVDYLLKPFKIDDLDRVVAKAVESIKESRHLRTEDIHKNYRLKEADSLFNEQKMAAYLQADPIHEEGVLQLLHDVGLTESPFFTLVYLPINGNHVIERYYLGDESLFLFSVKNVLRDIVQHVGPYYGFSYDSFFVVLLQAELDEAELEFYRKRIADAWEQALRLRTISGVSRQPGTAGQLQTSLKTAKSEILHANIFGPTEKAGEPKPFLSFMDHEMLLLEAIRNRDKVRIRQLVRQFAETLRSKEVVPVKELQHYSVEANLLFMRIHHQLREQAPLEAMPLWLSDLQEWERTLISMFQSIIDNANEDASTIHTISAVKHYIADHLNEDITLSSLAERFHFSPQYLSKRFKEMYNVTVINYLTQSRMEKAAALLRHTELPVQDIARTVGYEDDNYFGKVFRKHYGASPTQFRKERK
ncbi:response regulator [Paenibacillus antri]|uniref:Response regulator n=1 Tax=Paenibacillus antri TaxID=2582848 RepID=A0A5R9G459_9BACL|nr:response regulator [Paenibacillus antri]TLS49106.1 response regulator [Paenibacillus antri]